MKTIAKFAICVAAAFLAEGAVAQGTATPKLINYQGKLVGADGTSLQNGAYTLRFELFDSATGGTLVWGETRQVVVSGGVFGVTLGGAGATPVAGAAVNDLGFAFGSAERYLKTTIVGGPGISAEQPLMPRQQMVSVPFALAAETLGGHGPDWWVPAGTVVAFAAGNVPDGWLRCDGSAVDRITYSKLFSVIGVIHGHGDNSTTFNLPDYRGRFLRMHGFASTRDEDRNSRTAMAPGGATGNNVGSVQVDSTKRPNTPFTTSTDGAHTHNYRRNTFSSGGEAIAEGTVATGQNVATSSSGNHSHTISGGGDAETRPENASVQFIIKY